jgi:hypothetical protein
MFNRSYQTRWRRRPEDPQQFYRLRRPRPSAKRARTATSQLTLNFEKAPVVRDPQRPLFDLFPEAYQLEC